jgi:uncharacterized protein (DUF1810 family)
MAADILGLDGPTPALVRGVASAAKLNPVTLAAVVGRRMGRARGIKSAPTVVGNYCKPHVGRYAIPVTDEAEAVLAEHWS